ncbi:MAG: ABC transporter ATP-binding protein [Quadrisphaera sp.]
MSAAQQAAGRTTEQPVLQVEDLTVAFPTEDGVVRAVRGMTYSVAPREVLGIVGESGSGKSVSSMAVMGLLPRSAQITGRIMFRGEDVLTMSARQQRGLRGRRVSMIFQDPMTAMNPVYTVGDQLAEAVRSHSAGAAEGRPQEGQGDARPRRHPSGRGAAAGVPARVLRRHEAARDDRHGDHQRPDVIIADEPTTALDVTVQAQVLDTLMSVKDAVGAAIVFITHDLGVIAQVADRVLVMYAGKPVEIGTTREVFSKPLMPYTVGLLGSTPSAEGSRAGERLRPIKGSPPSLISLPRGCPFGPRCPLVREDCRASEPELRHRGAPASGGWSSGGTHRPGAARGQPRPPRGVPPQR